MSEDRPLMVPEDAERLAQIETWGAGIGDEANVGFLLRIIRLAHKDVRQFRSAHESCCRLLNDSANGDLLRRIAELEALLEAPPLTGRVSDRTASNTDATTNAVDAAQGECK